MYIRKFAGIVALGIIGHKNNWWKNAQKIAEKGNNNHLPPPASTPAQVTPPAATVVETKNR